MSYIPSPWSPARNNSDPIERCHATVPNYYPLNRRSPYVDPNFRNASYHRQAMPYYNDSSNSGYIPQLPPMHTPPAMRAYSSWTFPIFDVFSWER
jgi:hypothetical protein